MIYENQKNLNKTKDILKCKCGSSRIEAKVFEDDNEERRWVLIGCKRCGNTLFYNGA